MVSSWPVAAWIAANAVGMAWNLRIAARIVHRRRGGSVFLGVSAFAALLLAPGALVAIAAGSVLTGRAVHSIEWVWPVTLFVCTVQAVLAVLRHSEAPLMGLPLAMLNMVLLGAGVARYATVWVVDPAPALTALGGAHASVVAFVLGRDALASALALQVPLLAPSWPAAGIPGRVGRGLLTLGALVTAVLSIAAYPRAFHAASSFRPFARERLQERPSADLAVGLRILPPISSVPAAALVRDDLALVDSVGAHAIALVITPAAATPAVLDALSRALEATRRDSSWLVVSLGYGRDDRRLLHENAAAYLAQRLAAVEEIARRLRPDLLFPALDPYTAGVRALGEMAPGWWREFLEGAAGTSHRVHPPTRVGAAISAFTPRDSVLHAWAADPESPVDVVGLSLQPSYGGGASLRARLHVAEQWIQQADKPYWVVARGAYPRLWGERNQEHSLWGTLAWATRQRSVQGFLVDGAGDYEALTGLRTPAGRLRPAVGMLARARGAMAEP
jgi:hypothetical protein